MKILFVIDGLRPGGKERQLIEIIKNMDRDRFVFGIVTFNKDQHYTKLAKKYTSYFKELKKRPLRIEPLFSMWKCFKEFKPDIVHTWDSLSSLYSYLPSRFHKLKLIDGSIRDAGIDKGWTYGFKRFFLKRADEVVGNSYAGLRNYKVEGKVIYNALNKSRFLPNSVSKEFNIIMTANFTDYKDQLTFLKAAAQLVKNQTVDSVYLLGDGPFRQVYIDWINNNHQEYSTRFHFPGTVSNVEEYLAKCKVGILCSTPEFSEGLSNSVLEYMFAGLVPIVTDLGGSSEIVDNKKNGFLIKPKDSDKIVELVHLLKNEQKLMEKLVFEAKQTIEKKFSIQKVLGDFYDLYNELYSSKCKSAS